MLGSQYSPPAAIHTQQQVHGHHPATASTSPLLEIQCESPTPSPYSEVFYQQQPIHQVSSFSYAPVCEVSILSPVSATGSPSMGSKSKRVPQYQSSPNPAEQIPSSPETKGYWEQAYGASSGLLPPVPLSAGFGLPYPIAGSPGDDIPDPPEEHYFGSFGVSGDSKGDTDYYLSQVPPSTLLPPDPQSPLDLQPPTMYQSAAMLADTHAPNPHTHTPSHSQHLGINGSEPLGEPLANPQTHQLPYPPHQRGTFLPNTQAGPRRAAKKSRQSRRPSSVKLKVQGPGLPDSPTSSSKAQDVSDAGEVEPLRFKDDIPPEEQFLVEMRQKFHGAKGKTMWDDISAAYEEKFHKPAEKAKLQMKVSRAKSKWVIWSDRDTELLRQAYDAATRDWPKTVLHRFTELGGGSNLCWSAENIEMKLIEMGLDTFWSEHEVNARPRKRVRLSGGSRLVAGPVSAADQQQFASMGGPIGLTDEQRDCILDQIDMERSGRAGSDESDADTRY